METLNTAEHTTFIPLSPISLEDCCKESVYTPGYIQPNGVLLILEEPHLKIVQASENVEQVFGIPVSALLGQSLQRLFSRTQVKRIAAFLQQDNLERCNPFEIKARIKKRPSNAAHLKGNQHSISKKWQTFCGSLHRTANALILELEPQLAGENPHSIQIFHHLQFAILNLRRADSLSELAQILAKEVKAITGFDRVMIYRFEPDNHGVVIAEEKASHLESYLGLHYPATDIPESARRLFLRNWVRPISNVHHTPAQLMPPCCPSNQLDLSDCVLRGVHPAHIEYLQNMGVTASLTMSLIDDQRLWGLIACHHYSPKTLGYELRKTCEFLGQFAAIELVHQQAQELNHYRTQVKAIQDSLQQAFSREPSFIQQVLVRHAAQLLDLVHAAGVAVVLDQQISLIGQTPSLEAVQQLSDWLAQHHQQEVYLTNCLARAYPAAKPLKDTASGILAISVVLHQKSYALLWFRPEQIQTVNWAGNPQTSIVINASGEKRLSPRKSFQLWQEIVRETSLPWNMPEIEAAMIMRNTLMLALLEFSQAALEQAAERAAIANRAKSQFLAKMSHELRTPLNAILGFTQVMNRSANTPAEFQESLNIINRSGEYLLDLINDVLEMSKIEAGQLVLTATCFNLHRLLESLHDLFTLKASQKGLTLSFEKDAYVPRYVCSDESKLRQILINLISNAIKFTTQGSVAVRVRTEAAKSTGTETLHPCCNNPLHATSPYLPLVLYFEVEDTGFGIDCRDWETIFEPFMQTEKGRHAKGTGLGLSISRQFARLMGGDVTLHSVMNQGTTFTCRVVLQQPERTDLSEPETAELVVGLESGQPAYRILIVEDVLENQQLLQTLLESVGFEVRVAENGEAAIAQWQVWQPDLIFMDIQMPVLDGYETTRQIRLQESERLGDTPSDSISQMPKHSPVKIVALTAYAFEDDRAASLSVGCDDYVTKPFTEATLFNTIARHLNVSYLYAKPSLKPSISRHQSLMKDDFSIMPLTWIAQIHEAALDLNDAEIRRLIQQVPPEAQRLLEGIVSLVDDFQLETLANLTQV